MALELEMATLIKTLATRVQKLEMERDSVRAECKAQYERIKALSTKCDLMDTKVNQIGAKVGLRA